MMLEMEKSLASCAERSEHPGEPLRLGRFSQMMEHAKLPNESGHELKVGRSRFSAEQNLIGTPRCAVKRAVRKKAAPKEATPARPLEKKKYSKSKSNNLVCRYCGSADLAPSFIKRRDRRCRKCFSKRYGLAKRARKAKVKK
jgi:hypothetical protein